MATYIPAGRTSLVKRGGKDLQVQTEYAYRPYPRITTTILNGGQVLHKLEKKLERPIESIEEQNLAEAVIKKQHSEVVALISDKPKHSPHERDVTVRMTPEQIAAEERQLLAEQEEQERREKQWKREGIIPAPSPAEMEPKESLFDRCSVIPDFEHVYALTVGGLFKSENAEDQFKRAFGDVYKSLREVIMVFRELRGDRPAREQGVFEVERDRLYLVSTGSELFFVSVIPTREGLNYEREIKNTLMPDELQMFLRRHQP